MPPSQRDLLGDLAVRQRHHVADAERRAGRDEPLAVRLWHPALRVGGTERPAHLNQRLRVRFAKRVHRVSHHPPHRRGRAQRSVVAGVEPVLRHARRHRLEQRAG